MTDTLTSDGRRLTAEIDLSDEVDPTERMNERQQQAQQRAEDDENHREPGHNGSVTTEQFDVNDALEHL